MESLAFTRRASVKREFRCRPTENRLPDRTPLLLRRYFTDNNALFASGRILKRKVQIPVHFDFYSNYGARESEPFVFNPVRSDC